MSSEPAKPSQMEVVRLDVVTDDSKTILHSFYIDKKCALVSNYLKNILTLGDAAESKTNEVKIRYHASDVLEKSIEYFYYYQRWKGGEREYPVFEIASDMAERLLSIANLLEAGPPKPKPKPEESS